MAAVTILNLSDETHRAIKARAAKNERSTEAEIRAILNAAVRPVERIKLGSALREIARAHGVTNADVEALEQAMERHAPSEPVRFE